MAALTFTSIAANTLNSYRLKTMANGSYKPDGDDFRQDTDSYRNTNINDAVSALSEIAYNQLRGNVNSDNEDNSSNIVNLVKSLSANDSDRFTALTKAITDSYGQLSKEYDELIPEDVSKGYDKIISGLEAANEEMNQALTR
ncbi:MAG: hypothetical protein OCC45_06650 [Desulfotalea sp.]